MTNEPPLLDTRNMLGSIDMLSKQVQHAWAATADLKLNMPTELHNIVLFGMGGSQLGMDVVRHLYAQDSTVPMEIVNDYLVPAYVNEHTLAILSSYSGTTEETVIAAKTVLERTPYVAVVTTGGKLEELAVAKQLPLYKIEPTYNPCDQPRMAVGYAVTGILRMLQKTGVVHISDAEVDDAIHFMAGNQELLRDTAKETAERSAEKLVVYVGSEFLLGNVHVVTNQTNENGKHFAVYFSLPELNHHLLEGLGNPLAAKQLHFVFVESNLYHDRVQKRYAITKEVLDKQGITHETFLPAAATPVQQSFEVLQWGAYASFYIAAQHRIDPSPIPWVDYFKHALSK